MTKIRKAERTGWTPAPGIRITWMDGTSHWVSLDVWKEQMQQIYSEAHNLVFL